MGGSPGLAIFEACKCPVSRAGIHWDVVDATPLPGVSSHDIPRRAFQQHFFKIWNFAFEWSLGAGLPAPVTGVFYHIDPSARFDVQLSRVGDEVLEDPGRSNALAGSDIDTLLFFSWTVILPLISILFYCSYWRWIVAVGRLCGYQWAAWECEQGRSEVIDTIRFEDHIESVPNLDTLTPGIGKSTDREKM
ncbi:hypothetical protein K488DRAFT_85142 [Vararia minispora EC-137]|uniref:Uncharacterized protein n=1 Tax=Vararia minispora EC-137 TaxID=1314806 RepID=A0ACB8QMZ8_9AGAM|nr:hypothetical protein K488DRAFT_85142 [Vararia minispora EC-137]